MEQCVQNVYYQLRNQQSRVIWILAGIKNKDPGLQSAMAAVRNDKVPGGMQNNFESCVVHIVPYCPVSKKSNIGTKRCAAEISEVNVDDEEAEIVYFGSKSGKVPKTGVHIQHHKGPEYHCLSDSGKEELWEWRKTYNPYKKKPKSNKGKLEYKWIDKAIAAAVERKVE